MDFNTLYKALASVCKQREYLIDESSLRHDGFINTGFLHVQKITMHFVKALFVCLFEWTPSQKMEVGIPLGILPQFWEQIKLSYFPRPGQS